MPSRPLLPILTLALLAAPLAAEGPSRLLRQPTLSAEHVAFAHAGDIWIVARQGGEARRLTATPAVESDPHFSPDGSAIAFTSNRAGTPAVYTVGIDGGTPERLTWHPSGAAVRGWSPDGSRVLYASSRDTAPSGFNRLWTVPADGGPSQMIPSPWANDGSYDSDGSRMIVDRVSRWETEWRHYRGGQNSSLTLLDLGDLSELHLPNELTIDVQPLWMGDTVYFLSDRDWTMNVWTWTPSTGELAQLTDFSDIDIKHLAGHDGTLAIEREGWIHLVDAATGGATKLDITVRGDFPWARTSWVDIGDSVRTSAVSPTGKRAVFEARGEIFTVPVDKGDARNLTRSSGAADRAPVWSPDGGEIAWVSDTGQGYELLIGEQDGLSEPRRLSLGESVMVWETTWSPDGKYIAFVDDDVRVRLIDVETGELTTADVGGVNLERGGMGLVWSPDSKWLAYARTFPNNFRRIVAWSLETGEATVLSDPMADATSPAWDRDGKYLYFLASTDLALLSGWANTSVMQAPDPTYAAYAAVLSADEPTPFAPESDEEEVEAESDEGDGDEAGEPKKKGKKKGKKAAEDEDAGDDEEADEGVTVRIDLDGIERRTLALPMPVSTYRAAWAGPAGSVFIGESGGGRGLTIHKFTLEERESEVFVEGASRVSISNDGEKMLYRTAPTAWAVVGTGGAPGPGDGALDLSLRMRLDRRTEWRQIFDEAWHYQRDFFYDPDHHGRDWDRVYAQYAPLVDWVRHRTDLTYILDQVNGELSVGHSFVFGGDYPEVEEANVGLLGADLLADSGRWRIERIYTFESWNPTVDAPLDRPGLDVSEGDYILAVDGIELTADEDPFRHLDGTAGRQTVLHVNSSPSMTGARAITVEPIPSESELRRRAWVEDNRRMVDELSDGKLAYVWVPNTGGRGVTSFNRYYFAQQDKLGAVIDERYNGGGLLDDYMVDLMTRDVRAAITNEVPNGKPFRLPAGILGPKVLLINERAGSGGDYFPWVFRQQKAGPLIGTRTWGGLVKSSVHYPLVDGGALTAPDNAVFDPVNNTWIGENEGIPADIHVMLSARLAAEGRDPQLERGVEEALMLLEAEGTTEIVAPPFSTPTRPPSP